MPNNIQLIRQAIQEKNAQWSAKETNLSQLSVENKRAMLGAVEDTELINSVQYKEKASEAIHPKISIPTHFDWRERGKVSQVKDQLVCGSCVSFATAGLLESMALIEKDIELDLSEADLHFCSAHGPDCSGWYTRKALDSVNERGVCFEGLFTYAEGYNNEHPKCKIHANRDGALLKIEETDWFVRDISRKESIATHGPLVASFSVYEDFYYYGSGIYRHVYGDYMAGHAVLVVGYSDSEQCWICKNSWGENWGDNGYFKIAYGECSIDDLSSPFWSASKVTIKLRGNVQNHVVHDDGSIGALKGYYQWTNGWTSAGFYTAGSDTYLFILKAKGFGSDGNNVHIHKMNSDGTLGNQVEAHRWTEGWTTAQLYTTGSNKTQLFCLKKTWMTQVNVKFKRVKVLDVPLGENGKADMKLTFYVNGQKKTWPSSATYRTVSEGNTYNIGEEFEVRLMEFEQLSIIVSGIDVDRGDADGIPPDDKMGSIAKIFDHSDNWGSGTKNDKNDFYRIYYQISIVE